MTELLASEMVVGRTYWFPANDEMQDPAGTVRPTSIDVEHGDLYVTGYWTHEDDEHAPHIGSGAFRPFDVVRDVTPPQGHEAL